MTAVARTTGFMTKAPSSKKAWAAPVVLDLVSENERLRAALQQISLQDMACGGRLRPEDIVRAMQDIARRALAAPTPRS